MLVAIFFIATTLFYGEAKSRYKTNPDKEKSDFLYLEALRYQEIDSIDAFYELMSEAARLNPSDLYLANEIGFFNIALNYTDSAKVEENLSKIMAYIKANPTDEPSLSRLIRITGSLNRISEMLYALRLAYENTTDPTEVGLLYAKTLSETNDHDSIKKALNLVETIEANSSISTATTIAKMNMYLGLGDTASIINAGHKFLSSNPNSVENLTFLGDVFMQLSTPDSALVYYNRAIETDPSSGLAYFSRAQYFKHIGDSANYDREVFQLLHLPDLDIAPKAEILRTYVSELYTDSTQAQRIREMFTSLVDQYPHEEVVRELYGSYLWIDNDLNGAAEQFSYMLDINPDNKQSWLSLSQIYYNLDDYKQSISTCIDALKYFPDDYDIYSLIANISLFKNDYDTCNEYINKALNVADTTNTTQMASIYSLMGDLEYRKDNMELVMEYYEKSISLDPNNSVAYNNYAYYLACKNIDLKKALMYVNEALAIEREENNHNTGTTLDTYAWVLFKTKDYEKALEAIDSVLEMEQDDLSAELLHHAGDIYFMNGLPDEAVEFWIKALELEPENELLQRKVKHKTFFFE